MVEKLTSPEASPELSKDPSRRRTEIYMGHGQRQEHFKLRGDAEDDLQTIEKLHDDQPTTETTKETIAELVAANAATQATVSAIVADNATLKDDNATMKAMLTQLIQMQAQSATITAQKTELKPETETEPKTTTETETETELTTEQFTELQHMGVLPNCNDTVTYSHDLPVTSLFTELENANILSYTDHLQHSDSDQRRTVDFFSLYLHYITKHTIKGA